VETVELINNGWPADVCIVNGFGPILVQNTMFMNPVSLSGEDRVICWRGQTAGALTFTNRPRRQHTCPFNPMYYEVGVFFGETA
jgi:hypothetical protein